MLWLQLKEDREETSSVLAAYSLHRSNCLLVSFASVMAKKGNTPRGDTSCTKSERTKLVQLPRVGLPRAKLFFRVALVDRRRYEKIFGMC